MTDLPADPAVDLDAAADRLYGLDLPDFTAERKALAGAARRTGDRDLGRRIEELRVPTVSAWALNQLVRARPEQADALRRTGEMLRAAQAGLDAAALRALRPQRDQLLVAFVSAAASVAAARGQALSPTVQAEVRKTLVAALADERAQDAVLSGQLVKALLYAGLGEVPIASPGVGVSASGPPDASPPPASEAPSADPQPASASRPASPPASRSASQHASRSVSPHASPQARRERAEEARRREEAEVARRRAREARDRVDAADRALAAASLAEAEARRLADAAGNRVAEFHALLVSARAEHDALLADADHAARERADAAAVLERAQAQLAAVEGAG